MRDRGRNVPKGFIRWMMLGLLQNEPRHGYDIIRLLEERSWGLYRPSPGLVYPRLKELQNEGYLTSKEEGGRKIYTITDKGLSFLQESVSTIENIEKYMDEAWNIDNQPEWLKVLRDIMVLSTLVSAHAWALDREKIEQINDIVKEANRKVEAIVTEH